MHHHQRVPVPHNQDDSIINIDNTTTLVRKPLPYKRYIIDWVLIVCAGLGLELVCRLYGPYRRGFFCDDESIRYPYKSSTVMLWTLIEYGICINMITILAVECYRLHKPSPVDEVYNQYEHGRSHMARLWIRFAVFMGYFTACWMVVLALTTATKYPVGRLRPHFMDVCRPDVGYIKCNQTIFIDEYTCTTNRGAGTLEARLSFFSGHSSLATSAATYAVIYLQARLSGQVSSRVLVPLLQTIFYVCALFIGYSRIFDNWHHWSDVMVGCFVGTFVTALYCRYTVGMAPRVQAETLGDESVHMIAPDSPNDSCWLCKLSGRGEQAAPPAYLSLPQDGESHA